MAFSFNGLQGVHGAAPLTGFPFTACCMFKLATNNTQDQTLISLHETSTNSNFHRLGTRTNGALRYRIATLGGGSSATSATGLIQLGVWQHAAMICESATSRYIVVDGGNRVQQTTNRTATGINGISIGIKANQNMEQGFPGELANTAVYSRLLADSELGELRDGLSPEMMYPHDLVYSCAGISSLYEARGTVMSVEGGVAYTTHPRLQVPSYQPFSLAAAVVPPVLDSVVPTAGPEGTVLTLTGTALSDVTHIRFSDE